MKQTTSPSEKDYKHNWYIIDADNLMLGRLATKVIFYLSGKNLANYSFNLNCGSNVIVLNSAKIKLSKNKIQTKKYYSHSGYISGLKVKTAKEIFDKNPNDLIYRAVKGMLRKNKLQQLYLNRLHIYNDDKHKYDAQKPTKII